MAARVGTAACHTAAVAVFAWFDDAVAALLAGDGFDVLVVGQTIRVDRLTTNSAADIPDGAGAEVRDTLCRGRVHDVLLAGIARALAQGTALLRVDEVGIGASFGRAVVDCAVGVAGFVGDDLPFVGTLGTDYDVGSADCFSGARCLAVACDAAVGVVSSVNASLSEPGKANGRTGVASAEQSPMAVVVWLCAPPCREVVQSTLNV